MCRAKNIALSTHYIKIKYYLCNENTAVGSCLSGIYAFAHDGVTGVRYRATY